MCECWGESARVQGWDGATTYDTAVRDEAQEVQTAVAVLCALEAVDNAVDLVQLALFDGLVDADDL